MTEPYLDGLKNTSSRPDMKNISLSQDSSENSSEDNENDCSNETELTKEINNNQHNKEELENYQNHIDDISEINSYNLEKIPKNIENEEENEEKNPVGKIENSLSEIQEKKDDIKKIEIKKIILIISVIILLWSLIFNYFLPKSVKKVSKMNDLKFDLIDDLKKTYPNQSEYFWINIESCYKHSVVKSEDPSIILMIYDEESANTYSKLSREVLNYLDKIYKSNGHVLISTKDDKDFSDLIEKNNSDDSKLYVDSKLTDHFKSGGKLALIEDVNQFPAHSMVLFYAYGDEKKYAKFPGVLIFMSLKLDKILDTKSKIDFSLKPKKLREFAENYMFDLWSRWIREDQLRPLFTRIANNVILVNNE